MKNREAEGIVHRRGSKFAQARVRGRMTWALLQYYTREKDSGVESGGVSEMKV